MHVVRAASDEDTVLRLRRALWLSIALSVFGELIILIVWGVILYPSGELATKFLWTVVFCGLGMGSVFGALLVLFVVDRLHGRAAVAASASLSALVLGVGCNVLCFQLDAHYFHSFGGAESPALFIGNGVVVSVLGGALVGWLVFSDRGASLLARYGL